jgi:hypothetical protein
VTFGAHDDAINVLTLRRSGTLQVPGAYHTDISQCWEWSGRGLRPVPDTNEAYKLGVNYVMYGMTH